MSPCGQQEASRATAALTERCAANLNGVLSCRDRIIVTGTSPGACCAGGITSFLYSRGIRIFDCPRFAEPLRDRIHQRAQQVCEAAGVHIEHVNKAHIRKEDLVAKVLAIRGHAPGLVHVISAMELKLAGAGGTPNANVHITEREALWPPRDSALPEGEVRDDPAQ
ncbi:MAG TPA: hypothetical protein PKJ73_14885, partial [Ottowia sp.]